MANLKKLFEEGELRDFHHPVLSVIEREPPDTVHVELYRPKDTLGFKPAKLYLHLPSSSVPSEYAWDGELDDALILRGVKAINPDNEMSRFSLALGRLFKKVETRYGEGFFNAVLVIVVKEMGFANERAVAEVLNDIHCGTPYDRGRGLQDCKDAITRVIEQRAKDLSQRLAYPVDKAEEILVGATAAYLDERFSVTDGRNFGWK